MIGVSRAEMESEGRPGGRGGGDGGGRGLPRAARDPCDLPSASSRSPATAATDLPRRFAPAPPPNLGFPNPCREIYTFPLLPGFCFSEPLGNRSSSENLRDAPYTLSLSFFLGVYFFPSS